MYVIHKQIVISVKETLPLIGPFCGPSLSGGRGLSPRPHPPRWHDSAGARSVRLQTSRTVSVEPPCRTSRLGAVPAAPESPVRKSMSVSVSSFFISDNLLHSENVSAKLKLGSAFHWCKGTMISTGTCISDICIINVFSNAKDQSVHLSEGTLIDIHFLSNFVTQATNTL